jgi:hypothetical protein
MLGTLPDSGFYVEDDGSRRSGAAILGPADRLSKVFRIHFRDRMSRWDQGEGSGANDEEKPPSFAIHGT